MCATRFDHIHATVSACFAVPAGPPAHGGRAAYLRDMLTQYAAQFTRLTAFIIGDALTNELSFSFEFWRTWSK